MKMGIEPAERSILASPHKQFLDDIAHVEKILIGIGERLQGLFDYSKGIVGSHRFRKSVPRRNIFVFGGIE
jgi:hypothetical protein